MWLNDTSLSERELWWCYCVILSNIKKNYKYWDICWGVFPYLTSEGGENPNERRAPSKLANVTRPLQMSEPVSSIHPNQRSGRPLLQATFHFMFRIHFLVWNGKRTHLRGEFDHIRAFSDSFGQQTGVGALFTSLSLRHGGGSSWSLGWFLIETKTNAYVKRVFRMKGELFLPLWLRFCLRRERMCSKCVAAPPRFNVPFTPPLEPRPPRLFIRQSSEALTLFTVVNVSRQRVYLTRRPMRMQEDPKPTTGPHSSRGAQYLSWVAHSCNKKIHKN